jgi:hypothetical protein
MPSPKKLAKRRARSIRKPMQVHTVQTVFYADDDCTIVVKSNTAKYALNASLSAHRHLKRTTYLAVVAEVYDLLTGHVYAIVKMDYKGNVQSIYDDTVADARDFEDEVEKTIHKKGR